MQIKPAICDTSWIWVTRPSVNWRLASAAFVDCRAPITVENRNDRDNRWEQRVGVDAFLRDQPSLVGRKNQQ